MSNVKQTHCDNWTSENGISVPRLDDGVLRPQRAVGDKLHVV